MTAKIFVNYRRKQEGGWAAEAIATRLATELDADCIEMNEGILLTPNFDHRFYQWNDVLWKFQNAHGVCIRPRKKTGDKE